MKGEVSKSLIFGILAVVVIVVAIVGWKVFGPSSGPGSAESSQSASSREAHFKDHPGDKAVFDSMNKGAVAPGGGGSQGAGGSMGAHGSMGAR